MSAEVREQNDPASDPFSRRKYDLNGNRTDHIVGPANRLREDGTYRYDYDAEGNRYRRTHLQQGWVTTYAWDHRNRLTRLLSEDGSESVLGDTKIYEPNPEDFCRP